MRSEDKIYYEQYKVIVKEYGTKIADNANYGWAVTEDCVSTKVYMKPHTMILTTSFEQDTNEIHHEWTQY